MLLLILNVYRQISRVWILIYIRTLHLKSLIWRDLEILVAYKAIEEGGNMPCILNAANEVVVEAFLKSQIGF